MTATATANGKLDESAHRRADFLPGSPVTLADGQSWQLRKPFRRFVPDDATESGVGVRLVLPGNRRFSDLVRRREDLFSPDGTVMIAALAGVELALAAAALVANYALSPAEVADLIEFGYDEESDPAGAALRDRVMDVIFRRGSPQPEEAR